MALGQRIINRARLAFLFQIGIFWMSIDAGPNSEPEGGVSHPVTKPFSEVIARGADALPPLPVDESAAALELRLQQETDGRQEDRFYAIAFCTILVDMAVFQHLPSIG